MHHGEFKGRYTDERKNRTLILGESHHDNDKKDSADCKPGVPASYTTEGVVRDYLKDPQNQNYRFFDKITQTFGYDPELERETFWESVYFGNYIDVVCGVKTSFAKETLKSEKKRQECNDQLFAYANTHKISKIYCFSILAYGSLPSIAKGVCEEYDQCETIGKRGNKNVYLRKCFYKAGVQHEHTAVVLDHDLEVVGISHPSSRGGYALDLYAKALML